MKRLLSTVAALALLAAPAMAGAQDAREVQAARVVGLGLILMNADTQVRCNLNEDSAEDITTAVPEISPALAKRIVRYRTRYGRFNSILDVLAVPGLDSEVLRRNRHRISL